MLCVTCYMLSAICFVYPSTTSYTPCRKRARVHQNLRGQQSQQRRVVTKSVVDVSSESPEDPLNIEDSQSPGYSPTSLAQEGCLFKVPNLLRLGVIHPFQLTSQGSVAFLTCDFASCLSYLI